MRLRQAKKMLKRSHALPFNRHPYTRDQIRRATQRWEKWYCKELRKRTNLFERMEWAMRQMCRFAPDE